jgi:predicted ATPase
MLINSLGLKNFKCFEELDVQFAPITLLTGANSSGKSSLINAILAVLQTEQFPFYLSPNGKYVNMGSFAEMVFQNNAEKHIELFIDFNDADGAFDTRWQQNSNGLPKQFYEIDPSYNPKEFDFDKNFNYIGSFRQPPERTYYQKAKAQEKVDTDGGSYIDQIIEWEETDADKFAVLIQVIQQMGLFHSIRSSRLKGGRFELNVKISENARFAALTDVGFGVSQFLPIVVADLQLSNQSCLAVSQPEIHLHPRIQATFGNYLVNQIKQTQKQYIVETHSEYLLNRIRLLLVTGELKPEDVRVLYFENDGVKSTVHDIEFTTKGAVRGAPQGFFDTYEMDVMDIAMQAIG